MPEIVPELRQEVSLAIAKPPQRIEFKAAPTQAEGITFQTLIEDLQQKAQIETTISGSPSLTTRRKLRELKLKTDLFNRRIDLAEAQQAAETSAAARGDIKATSQREAERIARIIKKRKLEGVPLKEQFGLEAAEAVRIGTRLEAEQRARVLSAEIVGLPGQLALEKQKLRDIQKKVGFSSEGPLGFLGLTEGDIEAFPIIAESAAIKERPGRARVKLLAERGDILGAGIATAELIGRKGVELVIPPTIKESPGLGLLPVEFTPGISAIRGAFGLETLEPGQQFVLFGGTREDIITRGGLAGTTLAEFAALAVVFGGASEAAKFVRGEKSFKDFKLGQAGAIGKGRKRLPKRFEIKTGDIPGTFTPEPGQTEKIARELSKAVKEGGFTELGKLPKAKAFTPSKTFTETVRAGIKSGDIPDLTKFIRKGKKPTISKATRFEDVFDLKGGIIQVSKTKPVTKILLKPKTLIDLKPFETTAGLSKEAQQSFRQFVKRVTVAGKPFKKVEKEIDFFKTVKISAAEAAERSSIFKEIRIAEARVVKLKTLPPKKSLAIPGSAKALALGLPRRPKGDFEELEFIRTRIGLGELIIPGVRIVGKTEVPQKLSFEEKTLLAGIILTKQEEKQNQRQAAALGFAQPQRFTQLTKATQVQKEMQANITALDVTQPQALKDAEKQLQRQRKRTKLSKIFEFPTTIRARTLPGPRPRPGRETIRDIIPEKVKLKLTRLRLPEFKEEPGITPKQASALVQGFAVFLRRRGKFKRLGIEALPKIKALAKGFKRAEETAGVSVKIIPVKKGVKPSKAVDLRQFLQLSGRFRQSKGGIFIEKRRFRISTPGELKEITFAPRRKKRIASILPNFGKSKGGLSIL